MRLSYKLNRSYFSDDHTEWLQTVRKCRITVEGETMASTDQQTRSIDADRIGEPWKHLLHEQRTSGPVYDERVSLIVFRID